MTKALEFPTFVKANSPKNGSNGYAPRLGKRISSGIASPSPPRIPLESTLADLKTAFRRFKERRRVLAEVLSSSSNEEEENDLLFSSQSGRGLTLSDVDILVNSLPRDDLKSLTKMVTDEALLDMAFALRETATKRSRCSGQARHSDTINAEASTVQFRLLTVPLPFSDPRFPPVLAVVSDAPLEGEHVMVAGNAGQRHPFGPMDTWFTSTVSEPSVPLSVKSTLPPIKSVLKHNHRRHPRAVTETPTESDHLPPLARAHRPIRFKIPIPSYLRGLPPMDLSQY